MGLRDRFKKGAEEKKSEDIGGLVTENQAAYGTSGLSGNATASSASTLGPAPASPGGEASSGGDKGIGESGGVANLDIFTQETSGDEGNSLAKLLPEVDINDLLRECHEIADLLRQQDEERANNQR